MATRETSQQREIRELKQKLAEQDVQYAMSLRRERAAGWWMASTLIGLPLLITGLFAGAWLMYAVTISSLPIAVDAVGRGQVIERLSREGDVAPAPQIEQEKVA